MKRIIRTIIGFILVLCLFSANAELIYPYAELADEAASIERQELYMASRCAYYMAYGKLGFKRNIEFLRVAIEGLSTETSEEFFSNPSDYRNVSILSGEYTRIHAVFKFGSSAAVEIVSEPLSFDILVDAYEHIEETDNLSQYIKATDGEMVYDVPIDALLRAYPVIAADRCILYIYSPYRQADGLFRDVRISIF